MNSKNQGEVDAVISDLHDLAAEIGRMAEELQGLRAADGDDAGRIANLKEAVKAVRAAMPEAAGD